MEGKKINIKAIVAGIVALMAACGFGGYFVAPDIQSTMDSTVLQIEVKDCQEVMNIVKDCAFTMQNLDPQMKLMMARQKMESTCSNSNGKFVPEFDGCVIGNEVWTWNGEDYQLFRTI